MEARAFLRFTLLLTIAFLATLALSSHFTPRVAGATNTTYINAVLYIKTCTKNMLEEGSLLPHVVVKYNGSTVFNQECDVCRLYNISEGTYQVTVEWRGVIVYSHNIVLTASNATAVDIITGTRRVSVSVLNDAGNPITYRVSVKVTTPSGSITFTPGETHILPFGNYGYEASYSWMCDLVVKRAGTFNVNCETSGLSVTLPVASEVTFRFVKADGSSVKGLNGNATIYAVKNGKKAASIDFRVKDSIAFTNMPYGSYRVEVTVGGKKVISKVVEVTSGGKREFVFTIPVISSLKIKFLDADGEPVPLLPVVITTPWGSEYKLGTDSNGEVNIGKVPLGTYTIEASWQGVTIKKVVDIQASEATVTLPLRKVVAVIKPKASASLPKGLHLKVVLTRTGYVVKDTVLERDTPKWIVPLGLLLVDARYEAGLSYKDSSWDYIVTAKAPIWELDAPFYDISVTVKTLSGELLTGCNLTVKYDDTLQVYTLRAGSIGLHTLPDTDIDLSVTCNKVVVYSGSLRPSRAVNGTVEIKAYVTDIRLDVKGCCGRPLKNANVTILVSDGTKLAFSALTDDNGQAVFHSVPVPPGSTVEAVVRYKNYVKSVIIDPRRGYETVTLDVFLDTPLGALGLVPTIMLVVAIIVVVLASVLLLRRYLYVKEVEGLLVPELPVEQTHGQNYVAEYGYSEEYRGSYGEKSSFEKIKEFIRELFSGGEEEGEEYFG